MPLTGGQAGQGSISVPPPPSAASPAGQKSSQSAFFQGAHGDVEVDYSQGFQPQQQHGPPQGLQQYGNQYYGQPTFGQPAQFQQHPQYGPPYGQVSGPGGYQPQQQEVVTSPPCDQPCT